MFVSENETVEYEEYVDDGEVDNGLGRSLRKTIKKVVSAPVKAVAAVQKVAAKPLEKISTKVTVLKPLVSAQKKIDTGIQKGLTKVATAPVNIAAAIANPVLRTTGSVVKGVVKVASIPTNIIAKKSPIAAAILSPVSSMLNRPKASSAQGEAVGVSESVGVAVAEGPAVDIYLPDGSQGQIPSNYISRSGTYRDESGNLWSTTPPKMIDIYSVYGDKASVPEGLIVSGKYTDESGNVWSITAPKVVTIYSPAGDTAQIPETMLVNGVYTDESGSVWTTTQPGQPSIAQQIANALVTPAAPETPAESVSVAPSSYPSYPSVDEGASESMVAAEDGGGEMYTETEENGNEEYPASDQVSEQPVAPARMGFSFKEFLRKLAEALSPKKTELQGLGEDSILDTITSKADELSKLAEKGKAIGTAARKVKRSITGGGGSSASAPAETAPAPATSNKILGLPPAVVYGGATVAVAGLTYALIRIRRAKKK